MAFCTHCGAQIPDGAKFCTSCGAPLAAAPNFNPAPQPQAPVQQAPQPQAPQYNQPAQTRPVQPVQPTPTAQAPQGIVIDAPEGSSVTISDDIPQQNVSANAPAQKGEFVIASWSAPKEPKPQPQAPAASQPPQYQQPTYQQPPQYQQPQYPQQPYQQAPQYYQQPQQPQGPMTVKQALNKSKQDIFGKYMPNQAQPAAPAPAPEKKKKRSIWGWIVIILIGLVYLAMKLNW